MCIYKEFDVHKIPCNHTIVETRHQDIDVHSLVNKQHIAKFYILFYSKPIFWASDYGEWEVPKKIAKLVNQPLNAKKKTIGKGKDPMVMRLRRLLFIVGVDALYIIVQRVMKLWKWLWNIYKQTLYEIM